MVDCGGCFLDGIASERVLSASGECFSFTVVLGPMNTIARKDPGGNRRMALKGLGRVDVGVGCSAECCVWT